MSRIPSSGYETVVDENSGDGDAQFVAVQHKSVLLAVVSGNES